LIGPPFYTIDGRMRQGILNLQILGSQLAVDIDTVNYSLLDFPRSPLNR
jgi:hypothetical protein